MFYEIIKKKDQKTSEWSGGTTTQLLIYPKKAVYGERNFKWRLSSAKVEIERSTFTNLPGISRIIMIIEGELLLKHEKHHTALLKKFQQDSFSGEWNTESYGKVTDFNLMMSQGCKGNLQTIIIKKGECKEVLLDNLRSENYAELQEVFYCVSGAVKIRKNEDESFELSEGDLLSVTKNPKESQDMLRFSSIGEQESQIIRANIYY